MVARYVKRLGPTARRRSRPLQHGAPQRDGAVRRHGVRERGAAQAPVVPPEREALDSVSARAEDGHARDGGGGAGARGDADDGVDRLDARERAEPLERGRPEDRDERPQVLAHDHVGGHGERGAVVLAARERRPVRLGEGGEADREREERRRDRRSAGRPRERDAGETDARAAASCEPAADDRQEARRPDRGGEPDQPGERQQDDGRGASRGELVAVDGAAGEDPERGEQRQDGRDVERPDATPAPQVERHGREDDEPRAERDEQPEEEAGGREHALAQHGERGCACERGGRGADRRPDDPPEDGAAEADCGALGGRQQPPLAGRGAVPREAAAGRCEVAPERTGGEHGERDQERGRLASDEQEPPTGDGRVPLGRVELLDGEAERPLGGARLERGARPVGVVDQPVDLPEARRAGGERLHPAVAPVRAREDG